jgi:hypothetical protein
MSATLAWMLDSERATAAEPVIPIRIEYSAPASCPDKQVLFTHVLARTALARAAAPNEAARELTVRVDATNGRFRGRLLVPARAEDASQARELTDPSCDELIEALGFFIALSIDPHATASPSTTPAAPAASAAPRASEPESENTPNPSSSVPPPARAASSATMAPSTSVEPHRSGPRPGSKRERPWHFGLGAGAALVGGVAPKVLLGSRAYVDVSRERARDSVVAPFVSLGATSTTTAIANSALGGIALRWQALTGMVCPVELPISMAAVFRPCSLLEAGLLRGDGVQIQNARRTEGEWIALGLSGRLSLMVWSALFLELEVGGSVPVLWPRFRYNTGVTAFDTAPLGVRTGLTLVLRL